MKLYKNCLSLIALILVFVSIIGAKLPPKTKITGTKMELIKGGQSVIFTGGAKVVQENNVLKAEKIIHNKKDGIVEAFGNVNIYTINQDSEPVEAVSGKAKYLLEKEYGELTENRPLVKYYMKNSNFPVSISAENIVMDKVQGKMLANGTAELITSSGTAHAGSIVFLEKEKNVIMTGNRPYILYNVSGHDDRFEGDYMIYYIDKKKVRVEGNVKGLIKNYEAYNKTKSSEKL